MGLTFLFLVLAVFVIILYRKVSTLEREVLWLNKYKEASGKLLNAVIESNEARTAYIKSTADLCVGVMESDRITFEYAQAISKQVGALIELDKIKSNQIARLQKEKSE